MRLTWRYRWRPLALTTFVGLMDIKTGVNIAILFALLNKVAGVYGLIAVFTGGTLAQLSLYLYSVGALVVLTWGLRAVAEEDPRRTFYFAHLFSADHLLSTVWTVFFGVVWWVYTPHDGKRVANSKAQLDLIRWSNVTASAYASMTDVERTEAALRIWNKEKGFAAAVLVAAWLVRIYFIMLLYSYALHLRKGSYRSLPLTAALQPSHTRRVFSESDVDGSLHEDPTDELYATPLRTPNTGASFADFVSAGRTLRKGKPGRSWDEHDPAVDEVLFDEDERGSSTPGGFHSRLGTDETTSSSETDEATIARA